MPYLHDHLKNARGVKPKTALMRLYLEKARKYEGRKAEMEHNFILKIKSPVPSTSKVTSPKKRPASTQPPPPKKVKSVDVEEDEMSDASSTETDATFDSHPSNKTDFSSNIISSNELQVEVYDGDEDDGVAQTQEAYFTHPNPQMERHLLLTSFYAYLGTPRAGFKKERNRLQHVSQVQTILEDVDPQGKDISVLVLEEGQQVVKTVEKKATGTVKSHFYQPSNIWRQLLKNEFR